MKQTQKLDALISRIIKEELGNIKGISEDSKKKLYQNPEMEDEDGIHYLGSDDEHDYYYDEKGGFNGGTFLAQFDNGVGQHQSGFDFAYSKRLGLNKALKMAYDQKLLTAKDKKRLKQIELERRRQGVIKDGDDIFTLPDDIKEKTLYPSDNGEISGIKDTKAKEQAKKDLVMQKPVELVKPGSIKENEEEEMQQQPTGTEIAGQVAEIVEKLKAMSEGSEDPKKQKHAAKVMKYMESAKAALEALTAHETMLEEKDQAEQEKKAEKHKKNIEKIFKGIVKDENIVNRLKDKLSTKNIADLSKRLGEKGKELDEDALARIVLNNSLKEGWAVKKK
jgi:hypothetical protein